MDDTISEFFEGDKQLPGWRRGKALLAERMHGLELEEHEVLHCMGLAEGQQVSTCQVGNRLLPSLLGTETVFCTAWKQRVKSWPGGW